LGDQAVEGKTILIHPEQGLGDFIQFCRYVPLLETLGAKVVLEVPLALHSVLSTLKGCFTLVRSVDALPAFDLHCPIMSLPFAFKTTLGNIPANRSYLQAGHEKQRVWRDGLGEKTQTRIGLVWAGSGWHKNDDERSIPLPLLAPLLELPFEFHCLQKEISADELDELKLYPQLGLHWQALGDFSDTAALMSQMDLVVCVDTSVAYLAGALGIPVWILLSARPDYRWMLDRTDSAWYPTATLLRQSVAGDWPGVISSLLQQLQSLYPISKGV